MLFKSEVLTQASGSIGGVTYSHNRGGLYRRARSIPTDPATPAQVAMRAIFGNLSNAWASVLTAAQRAAWDLYGASVPVTGVLGDPINLTGHQWFIAANSPRANADPTGLPQVNDGPTTFLRVQLVPPSILSITASTSVVSIGFTATDAWNSEDEGGLIVLASRPQEPSINFFKGPYQLMGVLLGNTASPPTSPQPLTLPFVTTVGKKTFLEFRAVRADGRTSSTFRISGTAV